MQAFKRINRLAKISINTQAPASKFATYNPDPPSPHHNKNNQSYQEQIKDVLTPEQQRSKYFEQLRIFQKHSSRDLMNLLLCTKMLKYETIVKNSEHLYKQSYKMLGGTIVNGLVNQFIGKVYTGGNTLQSMDMIQKELEHKGVGLIVNYCDEAQGGVVSEQKMDRTNQMFIQSILKAQEVGANVGVKYSAICDPNLMKKMNKFKIQQDILFNTINSQNKFNINGQELLEGMQNNGLEVCESSVKEFLQTILQKQNVQNLQEVQISKIQWETLVHPWYIQNEKNDNSIISQMTQYNAEEIQAAQNIVKRMDELYEVAKQNPSSRIYVDAEQSFFQYFIESITVQYQLKYNKQEPLIYSTIQCYLKDSQQKIETEILKQKEFGVKLGVKLVKGAYLNEENTLPAKVNLNDGFDATSECYVQVAKRAIDTTIGTNNEVLLALHNDGNTNDLKEYMIENDICRNKVQFAQLLGMSDFISYSLPKEGFKTSKYVPFGETEIMIPYLCRRAYEGFKFVSNVNMQEQLLKNELKNRFHL